MVQEVKPIQEAKPDKPGKPDKPTGGSGKPDKPQKPAKCNVKVQLAVDGTQIGSDYEAVLGDVRVKKTAEEEITVFMFNFGKAQKTPKAFLFDQQGARPVTGNCPPVGSTLTGFIQDGATGESVPISVAISSDKKPTKYAVTLPEAIPEVPEEPTIPEEPTV